MASEQKEIGRIAGPLLDWFAGAKRSLPFRTDPSPYHVWVSEIMLQQTRVSAALPYYERFIRELPDIQALADCDPERLHKLWEGLGYYSRVRNLQKAAQLVCRDWGGQLPRQPEQLKQLPGIGDYTAGAIASISYGVPAAAVDGNVLRVFARLYSDASDITLPETKKTFTARVLDQQPAQAPGPFNEALMELGALICLPNGEPLCTQCPLQALCLAHRDGTQNSLPVKAAAKPRKIQPVTVALVLDGAGRLLLHRRPRKGLLAGLWEPVLWEETLDGEQQRQRLQALGLSVTEAGPGPEAVHVFTHVEWHMRHTVGHCEKSPELPPEYVWAEKTDISAKFTLPGAFKAAKFWLKSVVI